MLINQGININIEEDTKKPLHRALIIFGNRVEKLQIFEILIDNGADLYAEQDDMNIMEFAIQENNSDAVKLLIKKGIDIQKINSPGNKLIFSLIRKRISDNIDIYKSILNLGLDVNEPNTQGETPLIFLINKINDYSTEQRNKDNIIHYFYMYGLDVNQKNQSGEIPLIEAIKKKYLKIIKTLIELGADTNCIDDNFETPLIYAIKTKHPDIIKLILENKGDTSILTEEERINMRQILMGKKLKLKKINNIFINNLLKK